MGSSLAPWEGPTCPRAPQCWVLQRGCPRGSPDQSCGEGIGSPKWKEKRGNYPEKGGSGLSGLGDGEPGCSPFACGFSISTEPKRGQLPCSQTLPPAPGGHLGAATLEVQPAGPLQLPHSGTGAGTRHLRIDHPDTVHISSRPFRTWAWACLSLSFWGDISNFESHTTVKTRGRL